eukprot:EG_transcript_9598
MEPAVLCVAHEGSALPEWLRAPPQLRGPPLDELLLALNDSVASAPLLEEELLDDCDSVFSDDSGCSASFIAEDDDFPQDHFSPATSIGPKDCSDPSGPWDDSFPGLEPTKRGAPPLLSPKHGHLGVA